MNCKTCKCNFYRNCCNCCKCFTINEMICYICENQYEYFFSKPNVVGVGLGCKITKGENTFEKCIKVFMKRKIPENELVPEDRIPTLYQNIKTDVVESGIPKPQALTKKNRPVTGGFSIGPSTRLYDGSFGCLVTDGTYKYMLSNNHILADYNELPIGTPIIQPGRGDGGDPKKDVVAILSQFVPLKFKGILKPTNYVDCAIAKLTEESIASPSIALIGKLHGVGEAKLNEKVQKSGRTTDLTSGTVLAINTTFKCEIKGENVLFKRQIVTSAMAKQGDSGSVLVDKNDNAIGLLFSGNDNVTIFNSMSEVLKALKVKIITK